MAQWFAIGSQRRLPCQFRFLTHEERDEPYAQIGIFPDYARLPVPAWYFEIEWHSGMAEERYVEGLHELAHDIYWSMRELSRAAVERKVN